MIAIIFTMSTTVYAIVNHYHIIKNEEYKKVILFNGYVDKEYKRGLFIKNNTYDINEIEKKLNLSVLKNKYIKDNTYNLFNIVVKDNNITKLNFWLTNPTNNINVAFEVNTDKNATSEFSMSGRTDYKTYFIETLNAEALIYEAKNEFAGPLLANFEYKGLIYSIELDKVDYSVNDLFDILDSFYY